jgi:hypothetical protein
MAFRPDRCECSGLCVDRSMKLERIAPTTEEDRTFQLAKDGPVLHELGELRLPDVTVQRFLDCRNDFIVDGDRSIDTGRYEARSSLEIFAR